MQTLLHAVCIRRTRDILEIPKPIIQVKKLAMTQAERSQYRELLHNCKMKIDMAVSGKRKGRLNSTVLESLLDLRLFCNNGKALTNMSVDLDEAFSLLQQSGDDVCAYCGDRVHGLTSSSDAKVFDEAVIIPECGHLACQACLPEYLEKKEKCPACAHNTSSSDAPSLAVRQATHQDISAGQNPIILRERYPTKLRALLDDIIQNRSQKWYKSIKPIKMIH